MAQKPDGASANMEGQLRDVKVSAVRVDDKAIGGKVALGTGLVITMERA